MKISVENAGEVGLVEDIHPSLLPPNAWSEVSNVRFDNGSVKKILGCSSIDDTTCTDTLFVIPVIKYLTGNIPEAGWVYCGTDDVYYYNGTDHEEITRSSGNYTGDNQDYWTGVVAQNILYLTNGYDTPQVWLSTDLEDLPWDADDTWADKGYSTKILRTFKNFIIALTFNDGTGYNDQRVYWSDPAEPWTAPSSWDWADETNLAGYVDLAATKGSIVDGLPLRDSFMVYKEDAIISMNYVGGASIFAFRTLIEGSGLMSMHAVKEFDNKHFVVGQDDIYVTDGNSLVSILDKKLRSEFFSEINTTLFKKTFVLKNHLKKEMWVCYPSTGSQTYCDKALIWNWVNNTWTRRDLPDVHFISSGVGFSPLGDTWDDDTGTWDADSTTWDSRYYNPALIRSVGCSATELLLFEDSYTDLGESYTSYVLREYLQLNPKDTISQIKAVYPRGSGEMNIYVGACMHQNDAFTWEGPYTINPSTDAQIRCRVTGRYHAIKFEFSGDTEHSLQSYEVEYVPTGYGR